MHRYFNEMPVLFLLLYVVCHGLWPATATSTNHPKKLLTYSLPENIELKKAFGFEEDTYLNFTEITAKNGHRAETHKVLTTDGYVLTMFRILPKCIGNVKPYPVLLVHGIFDSSDTWILAGPDVSVGFILSSNCYDVWAANLRGNVYSREHIKLDPNNDKEYWNYSFDEHGNYDIPVLVDYILKDTGKSRAAYVGHSQGTTANLVINSMKPEYNEKMKLSILLAPIAWMGNMISLVPLIGSYNVEALQAFIEGAGFYEILGKNMVIHNLLEFICQFAPKICEIGLTIATGHKSGTINQKTVSVAFGHLFSGGSTKTLVHLAQLVVSGRFQRFDEGVEGNLKRYGVPKPPEYNISQITSPVLLVSAKNDWFSSLKDVKILASKLSNLVDNYEVAEDYWSHQNHVWDTTTQGAFNAKLLDYLEKYT